MSIKLARIAACALAGAITLTGTSVFTYALPNDKAFTEANLPMNAFLGLELEKTTVGRDNLQQEERVADTSTTQIQPSTPEGSLAAAQVEDFANIRVTASEEGEIIGKLYQGGVATILEEEGDWYQISSGSVTGYIKGEYLVYGNDAQPLIEDAKSMVATVNADALLVREDTNTDAAVLDALSEGDQVEVEETLEGWNKISVADQTGYISADYVSTQESYQVAESKEEEEARLAAEAQSQHSSLRQEIAAFAQQFVGNPYVWGGTSLTNGADCSGFTQAVFAHFGYHIPRDSRSQASGGGSLSVDDMQPGDLLFYSRGSSINHVALYIGDGKVVHASNPKTGIKISNYDYRSPVKVVSYL